MEVAGPSSENSLGDQLGQELKCSELGSEEEEAETVKINLVIKSRGMFVTPTLIPKLVPVVCVVL